jgi:hypothetical protein
MSGPPAAARPTRVLVTVRAGTMVINLVISLARGGGKEAKRSRQKMLIGGVVTSGLTAPSVHRSLLVSLLAFQPRRSACLARFLIQPIVLI